MKKLAIGAGIVFALVVILALLPFAVDLNKHKGAILEHIRTVTARQVDFGSIRLTILTGLGAEITGMRIADDPAFSTGDFLTLKGAKVKVALLPMIKREIKVRKVVLDEPRLSIIRNRGGAFNFKTLLIPRPEKAREGEAGPGALERLMVGDFEVKNGVLTYHDRTSGPEVKHFTVSDIDLESSGISPARPIPFLLSAAVMSGEGQNLNVKGTLGPVTEQGGLIGRPSTCSCSWIPSPWHRSPSRCRSGRGI
ncbi:MAG: AsmA family protein [Desulfobacterota bacterium]|nr:AsmA family protein [Thermodesulfobacteriota bacterium]